MHNIRVFALVLLAVASAEAVYAQPQPTYYKASAFAFVDIGPSKAEDVNDVPQSLTAGGFATLDLGPFLPDLPTLGQVRAAAGAGTIPAFEQFPSPRLDNTFGLHAIVYRFVNPEPELIDTTRNLTASATAVAKWDDSFVITSQVYAPGTPVMIRLGIVGRGILVADCARQTGKGFHGRLTLSSNISSATRYTQGGCGGADVWGAEFFETRVGEILFLGAYLDAVVGAIGPTGIVGIDYVDASRSLYFYIDPTDPNVSYQTASGRTYFTPPEIPDTVAVTVAIMPDGHPMDLNPINLESTDVLPVALLTTTVPAFDALATEQSSITIGDPALTGRVHPVKTSYEDVDGDGDIDLVMHFSVPELVASGALNRETKNLQLAGQLRSGVLFMGSDHVVVRDDSPTGDTFPPTTTAAMTPSPNGSGWHSGTVTVNLSATDNEGGSGVKQISYTLAGAQSGSAVIAGTNGSVDVSSDGVTILTYFAMDDAGNAESAHSVAIQIDRAVPNIIGLRSPDVNANNWNNSPVTVIFKCSDALSGLAAGSLPTSAVVSAEGAGQSVSGTCRDVAGNAATALISNIAIDMTPPMVTYANNAGSYTVDQTVNINCVAIDPTNSNGTSGSGVASTTCHNVSGSAYTFKLGNNSFSASAIDKADNVGNGSASFSVGVTCDSLCRLTKQFVEGSARFAALRPAVQAQAAKLITALCDHLANVSKTPGQKTRFVSLYQLGVSALGRDGWLTEDQSATLINLSKAL